MFVICRSVWRAVLAAMLLGTVGAAHLDAQGSAFAVLSGTVYDTASLAVPGASVSLVQEATGAQTVTTTDASGRYAFPRVTPGDYTLRVEMTGFRQVTGGRRQEPRGAAAQWA